MIDGGTGRRAGPERIQNREEDRTLHHARHSAEQDMHDSATLFLLGRRDRKSDGATSQLKGLRRKMRRSQYVKVSPG